MSDSSNKTQVTMRLASETVQTPPSLPPDFDQLTRKVAAVRRRRRVVMTVAAGSVAIMCLATVFAWQGLMAPNKSQINVAQGNLPDGMLAESNRATSIAVLQPSVGEESSVEVRPPKIQLYALMSQSVPVFDVDEKTKTIHHVGWVESQQDVPVDMNYVSENQQNRFGVVLEADEAWHLSL
ncbi:hypothetical protein [Planctomycetes bacterium K23_9]|uniref:Uncharacterized protein n=1 Tax=Stieleria marina TaxID=1930275 RepID=A0A517NZF2_9BACT|nr:hypothetical protein K239x_45190 [Planctomycetes bacterium K23_9]